MPLPQPAPQPLPILGYAGSEAIQLDPRALARIRLGNWFLIAYMASSLSRWIYPLITSSYAVQVFISAIFAFCLVIAAGLLAANTRLPSDRTVFRRLLLAAAVVLAITTITYTTAICIIVGDSSAITVTIIRSPGFRFLQIISPFYTTAYALCLCLCLLRLADLARRFQARATALQCLIAAVLFFTFSAIYSTYGLLISYFSANSFHLLTTTLSFSRVALSLWTAIVLASLLPRLKPTPT